MSRLPETPAMPMGAKFDPELSVIDNARNAREYDKHVRRTQAEKNAKVLARRVFRTDDLEFDYIREVGTDVPTFTFENELIAFGQFGRGEPNAFALIEFCSNCGKEPDGRTFNSLATLGRVLEERDADDAHVCRMCKVIAETKGGRK